MTEQQAINSTVEKANSQVGYHEGENNWNKYAAYLDPLKITFGDKQNQPWCGEFILWLFVVLWGVAKGLAALCSPNPTGIPLCRTAAQYFKDKGRWGSTPKVGAIVFFFYDGAINHTGIVTGVSSLSITTVEGNSSDMVARRTYAIGDSKIAGFGYPDWSVVAESVDPPEVNTTNDIPMVKYGDVSEVVRAAQFLLIGRGFSCGSFGADGDFGSATQSAAKRAQAYYGLDQDGIIGPATWAALLGVTN